MVSCILQWRKELTVMLIAVQIYTYMSAVISGLARLAIHVPDVVVSFLPKVLNFFAFIIGIVIVVLVTMFFLTILSIPVK